MKVSFKIFVVLAMVFIVSVGFVLWGAKDSGIATTDSERKVVLESTVIKHAYDSARSADAEKRVRIQALKDEITEQYLAIIQLSGASGTEHMAYEDNWCVAAEDLSESDAIYAANELKEWELSRGKTIPRGGSANALMRGLGAPNDEFPGLNDEYLDAYREADNETLIRLGEKDDMLALTTMLRYENSGRFDRETELRAAKQLIVLGDTHLGLRRLIIDSSVHVAYAKNTGEGNPIDYLKSALALIEFGMMRQDASGLDIFLSKAADYEKRLGGINPAEVLSEQDFAEISQMAQAYYDDVNKARIEKGLPMFDETGESKIAQVNYADKLSSYYGEYAELLESNLFPSSWKESYLSKTPCVERRIATHNFLVEQLPVIQNEIAMLEKSSN